MRSWRSVVRWITGDDEILARAESERIRAEAIARDMVSENASLREEILKLSETVRAVASANRAPLETPQDYMAFKQGAGHVTVGSDFVKRAYARFAEDVRRVSRNAD